MATTPYFPQYPANSLASRYNTSTPNRNFLGLNLPVGQYSGANPVLSNGLAIDPSLVGPQSMVQNTAAGGLGPRANDRAIDLNLAWNNPFDPSASAGALAAYMPANTAQALLDYDKQQYLQRQQTQAAYDALPTSPKAQALAAAQKDFSTLVGAGVSPLHSGQTIDALAASLGVNPQSIAGSIPVVAGGTMAPNFPTYAAPTGSGQAAIQSMASQLPTTQGGTLAPNQVAPAQPFDFGAYKQSQQDFQSKYDAYPKDPVTGYAIVPGQYWEVDPTQKYAKGAQKAPGY